MTEEKSIDWQKINSLQKIGGTTLLKKLYTLFLEKTPQQINAFFQNYQTQNWKNIENTAHSLKSSSGNLGLLGLYKISQEIEIRMRNQEASQILLLIESFQKEFEKIQVLLKQELQKLP